MIGWTVEYSEDDGEEVCIIPRSFISSEDFMMLLHYFEEKGYKYSVASDERCGYRFVKGNKSMDCYVNKTESLMEDYDH